MSKNVGKIFEEDFIKSVPQDMFKFRFRDLPYHLTKNSKYEVNNNPADFMIFNGETLYILELKSTSLSSYPFSNTRDNQVNGLLKYSKLKNVVAGFVINLRKYDETYFLNIDDYIILKSGESKSISRQSLQLVGYLIPQKLKRTRYSYDLERLFKIK